MKNGLNENSAIHIMMQNPSSIKRPVLVDGDRLLIGFKENEYKTLL
jgi:arsenate reductase